MIIGYDGSRAFTNNRTGTENYSYQILWHLAQIDQTNSYHIYLRPNTQVDSAYWPDNFLFQVVPYPRLWTQAGLSKKTFLDKDIDVLFVPSHTLPLIRRPNLKTVVTMHDLGAEYLPATHQLKQKLYLKLMTYYQLKSATQIVAVSQATKNDIINKVGISREKISVIYEGFDQEQFKPLKNDVLRNTLKDYDIELNNYFMFVGTIQPRKNLERLIRAYAHSLKCHPEEQRDEGSPACVSRKQVKRFFANAQNDNIKLVLAGSKGWLSDEIYALPQKLGIEKQVKFLGFVPDEKLPALYSGAKALLFPSLFEGFGLPVLEAMACGCPVITSNTSSLPEVAGNAALLVDPYNEEEIAQAIYRITAEPKLGQNLKDKGFTQIKKFSWEKAARETLRILEKTAA